MSIPWEKEKGAWATNQPMLLIEFSSDLLIAWALGSPSYEVALVMEDPSPEQTPLGLFLESPGAFFEGCCRSKRDQTRFRVSRWQRTSKHGPLTEKEAEMEGVKWHKLKIQQDWELLFFFSQDRAVYVRKEEFRGSIQDTVEKPWSGVSFGVDLEKEPRISRIVSKERTRESLFWGRRSYSPHVLCC